MAGDNAGPRVHDHLVRRRLPAGLEVVDGGLAGLNLLRLAEGARRLVFVDQVRGFAPPDAVVVLTREAALAGGGAAGFGHGGGLGYLLAALPAACEGPLPAVRVVGLEAPCTGAAVARAAALALAAAVPQARS